MFNVSDTASLFIMISIFAATFFGWCISCFKMGHVITILPKTNHNNIFYGSTQQSGFVVYHYAINHSWNIAIRIGVLFLSQIKLIPSPKWNVLLFLYIWTHIIMDFRLVYSILAILNRWPACVNYVWIVNIKVLDVIQYNSAIYLSWYVYY